MIQSIRFYGIVIPWTTAAAVVAIVVRNADNNDGGDDVPRKRGVKNQRTRAKENGKSDAPTGAAMTRTTCRNVAAALVMIHLDIEDEIRGGKEKCQD
jgi:hypothetical protein